MADDKPADKPAESGASGLEAAANRIRDTAKWLVTAFGAVATVLVAGLQLTSLSDATGDARHDALVGYGLGVGGALLALFAAAVVLTPKRRTLHDLEKSGDDDSLVARLNKMSDVYAGFEDVPSMVRAINDAYAERTATWLTREDNPTNDNQAAYVAAVKRANTLTPLAGRLLRVATFEHLRRVWSVCLPIIVLGGVLSATGAAIFAANTAKKADPEAAVPASPRLVRATLTDAGAAAHRAELGAGCNVRAVRAVATASDADTLTLLVVPTPRNPCGPASLVLKREEGSVVAIRRVSLRGFAAP